LSPETIREQLVAEALVVDALVGGMLVDDDEAVLVLEEQIGVLQLADVVEVSKAGF
jgi:hypothetical protein